MKVLMSLKPEPIVPNRTEPTAYELATLAARLYTAQFQPKWKYQHLSQEDALKDALAWWVNARELLDKWRANPEGVFPEPPPPPAPKAEPARYPVTLDQFLLLMLPHLKGRTADRASIFRDYLRFRLRNPSPPSQTWPWDRKGRAPDLPPFDCCHPRILLAPEKSPFNYSPEAFCNYVAKSQLSDPTKDDVDRYFALWQSNPIPDRNSFLYHAHGFRNWYQITHGAEVSAKHRAAGAKGLASPKRKNSKSQGTTGKPDKRKGSRPPIDRLRQVIQAEG